MITSIPPFGQTMLWSVIARAVDHRERKMWVEVGSAVAVMGPNVIWLLDPDQTLQTAPKTLLFAAADSPGSFHLHASRNDPDLHPRRTAAMPAAIGDAAAAPVDRLFIRKSFV
jgi:hypothetical protein